MLTKVLVANRGEIAVRILRTLREMGITSVAVFSDVDRDALFVDQADEAYRLGPSSPLQSYLNGDAIIEIARQSGAEAIHPGYGFLAENATFAEAVASAGLTFIGPPVAALRLMGDKVRARNAVQALGVPVVPGTPGPIEDVGQAVAFAETAGYPIAVKAAGGGGGRGMRVARGLAEVESAVDGARREAAAYFKNPEIYLERYFHDPRHVEVQVLGDSTGRLVHLGERDCSAQRRYQKLIEESPSPAVDRDLRERMGQAAIAAAQAAAYSSAGTVEFLLSRDGEFYFLEMNTRIQVEHPVTEFVTGVDLVREMVLIAAGEPMTVPDSFLDLNGHAIEVRINAEDPTSGFQPTPAAIIEYREPGGPGVRVDSGVYAGYAIPPDYDSLMAKVITWAPDRETCRRRMVRALGEYRIDGPASTIAFDLAVLASPEFVGGRIGTTFVETNLEALAQAQAAGRPRLGPQISAANGPVRDDERVFDVEVNRKLFTVRVAELKQPRPSGRAPRRQARAGPRARSDTIVSPMHGTVIAIKKQAGESIEEGEPLFIIEAMKMENEVRAHRAGTVASIGVALGDTVETEQPLATLA